MKPKLLPILALVLSGYVCTYGVLRCNGTLIQRLGKEGYWMSGTGVFEPAWVLERKTRSLCWRVHHGAPWFGHVYWNQLKR